MDDTNWNMAFRLAALDGGGGGGEDEEAAERRRARARALYAKKREEEELMAQREAEGEEEEEESEYETDSDYDEFSSRPAVQPVFVRKQDRETIEERDKRLAEEEKLEKLKELQLEARKKETEKMVKEEVQRAAELAAAQEKAGEIEKIDSDEEEEDEAKEYELWKQREIARIKRDREERESFEREKEETAKRRNLTDMELRHLDKDKFAIKKKNKLRFMQRYYHKGAFFRDGDDKDIHNRDFSAPTGDDHFDKEKLPKIKQVKNFGRSGRTKYTHLADQDTTQADAGWAVSDSFNATFVQKLGGLHGGYERPSFKKNKTG